MIGIYRIRNTSNGKVYIGQTKDIERRKQEHFSALERGKHPNHLMQTEYARMKQYFVFEVLEECKIEDLNDREAYWIKRSGSACELYGYNLTKGGDYIRKNQWGYKIKKYKNRNYRKTTKY